jgi:hypothetical protein
MIRAGLIAATALLCLALLATTANAFGPSPGAEAAKTKGGKTKKCRKGQVRVKLAGKTRCLPVGKALPKPKAGDLRLAIIKEALTPELGHVPDPKDKIPPPMEKVYRSFSPKALPAMEKAVGAAVTRLDNLAEGKAGKSALAAASLAQASAGGNEFTQTVGNVTIDARLTIAIDATQQLVGTASFSLTTDQGGGRTLKVTTEIPIRLDHFGFKSQKCPTAEGKLDATDGIGVKVRSEVRSNNGKTLEEFYEIEVVDDTEMQGIVADDAKLDTLEIRSIEDITEKAGGSIWGGSIIKGSIVRNTVVNMRTGEYDPHVTVVNVGVVLSGVLGIFTPAIRPLVAQRLKASADKGFAKTVDFEMKQYRELEQGWNQPNTCARLAFSRASRSLTLRPGDTGNETVRLDATRGGSPAAAMWSLSGQENGTFELNSDSANPTTFRYTVIRSGNGVEVKGTFKSISKAGVAEDSWIQKTSGEVNHLTGNFSGEIVRSTEKGPSVESWSGTATLDRSGPNVSGGAVGSYALASGGITYQVSGQEGLGVTACQWSGSKVVELPAGSASGSGGVLGAPPKFIEPPYTYSIRISTPPLVEFTFTRHDCPPGAEEEEGKEETIPFGAELDTGEQTSPDGIVYTGSKEESFLNTTITENWNFEGKP